MTKKQYITPSLKVLGTEFDAAYLFNDQSHPATEDGDAKERGGSNLINFGFESSSDDDEW